VSTTYPVQLEQGDLVEVYPHDRLATVQEVRGREVDVVLIDGCGRFETTVIWRCRKVSGA